jgi:SAM-dependent methyltransferase
VEKKVLTPKDVVEANECLGYALQSVLELYSSDNRYSPSHKRVGSVGGYHFIPYPPHRFTKLLLRAKKLLPKNVPKKEANNYTHYIGPPTFLDCGCGVGWTLKVARAAGFRSRGIEYDKDTINVARKLCNPEHIIEANLLEYKDYSGYDVIYYYHPFSDHNSQEVFERLLFTNLKPGALVIACRTYFFEAPNIKFLKEHGIRVKYSDCTNYILQKNVGVNK